MSEYFRKPIVKTLMLKGQEGQSIKEITKTGTSGLVDTYTITLTDGTTSTFSVENGKGISSISKTGTSGLVDTYTVNLSDGNSYTFNVTNGNGIKSIEKTGTSGLINSYKITLNDGSSFTFNVKDGETPKDYLKKSISYLPSGDTLKNEYWINVGTGIYFADRNDNLENFPAPYAFVVVSILYNAVNVIVYEHLNKNYYRLSGGDGKNTGWIDYTCSTMYPVGSIYISADSTSPASLYGGTWEQIKDHFLLAAGDTYEAGSTGGEAQHPLTVDEMPSHYHDAPNGTWVVSKGWNTGTYNISKEDNGNAIAYMYGKETQEERTTSVGGSQPHNNMPPYFTVYMWKRIA